MAMRRAKLFGYLSSRAQHRFVGIDQHLDEGFRQTRLVALAHGTEYDEVGKRAAVVN